MPIKFMDVAKEYAKNKDLKKEDIEQLKQWVDKQPHLPPITELQLILFLHSCYFSIEAAKTAIDAYFTMKTHCPELFAVRDPRTPAFAVLMNVWGFFMLPKATPEGYRVVYCKIMDGDVKNFNHTDQVKNFDMNLLLWQVEDGTAEGFVIIFDADGFTFGHLAKMNVMTFKKFFYYLQEALPVRMKGLHFINTVPLVDKLMALAKPFIKSELMSVIYFHASAGDELYKYVPQEILPAELGGSAHSFKELHEIAKRKLIENADFFKEEEKKIIDESQRPEKPKTVDELFGVDGSFKKLNID